MFTKNFKRFFSQWHKKTGWIGYVYDFPERGIECVSFNNWPCQARPTLVDINSNETLFYLFIVSVNNCSGSCNTIYDPYVRVCIRKKVKNMNVKECNLISSVIIQNKNGIIMNVTVKNLSYGKINSVNPLYLIIDAINGYVEENNINIWR